MAPKGKAPIPHRDPSEHELPACPVKKAYRKALLAVHPDKQDPGDVEKKVLAQLIFDALRDAWNLFEKTG